IDVITYIPSSEESFHSRGFNQCEVICKYISKECNIPNESLMYKTSDNIDQIGLDSNKRWDNVRDSFELKMHKNIKNKRVLLIDDVITSGATAFYGAKCLKENGAGEVYILTVAKSRV
ncbi:MAG: ComF family protein, partial [Clostridia bacterium]